MFFDELGNRANIFNAGILLNLGSFKAFIVMDGVFFCSGNRRGLQHCFYLHDAEDVSHYIEYYRGLASGIADLLEVEDSRAAEAFLTGAQQALLEDSDLTEEQKQEFLQTIWNIIIGFVDLGFGVHPVEQAQIQCGQLPENLSISALTALDGVKYSDRLLKEEFEDAAERKNDPVGEFAE